MERLKRVREPAALVALGGLAAHLVLVVVSAATSSGNPGLVAASLAAAALDPFLLVLVAALLALCWTSPVATHARGLTRAGLGLVGLALATALALAAVGAVLDGPDSVSLYLFQTPTRLVAAVVAVLALVTLLRRPDTADAAERAPEPALAAEPEPAAPDPQLEPGWTSETAVGTVWRRAGDAGSQGPATSWEAPGQAHPGWGPAPNTEPPAVTSRPDDH